MALYGVRIQVIGRSDGRSAIAAASYRTGEKLWDERGERYCHKQRSDVEQTELLLPADAPLWARQATREEFWQKVERAEIRKDAQLCHDLRIQIPREFDQASRIRVVRDFILKNYVSRGQAADISWHCPDAGDGGKNPHAHVMLTMRPFTDTGFGKKSRHNYVRTDDGRCVSDNPDSWNDVAYYNRARVSWQDIANAELERIGSSERIDHRSYVERGLSKVAQPMLNFAIHAKRLYGRLQHQYGQWLACRLYSETEQRANDAFAKLDRDQASPAERIKTANRFVDWYQRQIARLSPEPVVAREQPSQGLER